MDGKPRFSRTFITLIFGFLACCWMFFLGVLVGRGTAPVSFDTHRFQASLAGMATASKKQDEKFKKPELEFYEVLKNPVRTAGATAGEVGEILPAGAASMMPGDLKDKKQPILKRSLKAMTVKSKPETVPEGAVSERVAGKPSGKVVDKKQTTAGGTGEYTIQVAAYRELNDALKEVGRLKAKGIFSYRTMGRVGNDIWHRVRTGSFNDMASAQKQLNRLHRDGIKGMILNKKE